jgi:16S rRNA (cytosine1407-C5)-methyltransferase
LDLPAAPGCKTTHLAEIMCLQSPRGGKGLGVGGGSGVLIANDVQEKRLWSLISNLHRCGVTNAAVTRKVGQWFAGNMTEIFDRVLCDAPCTAQGTARKDSDALEYCSMDNIGKMARLQRELLESAVHACKVGGRIVYSTCTLTPEENEEVVRSIMNKFSTQLVVIDPWEVVSGQWLVASVAHENLLDFEKAIADSIRVQASLITNHYPLTSHPFLRLWPQTYDTEGFFCAVLEKRAPTRDRQIRKEIIPHQWTLLPNARRKNVAEALEDWFGTSFLRDDELLFEMKEQLFLLPADFLKFPLLVNPYMGGIPFGKATSHGLTRLSHEMTSLRGHEATKQILRVSEEQRLDLFKGANLELSPEGFDDGDLLFSIDAPAIGNDLVFGRGMLKNGTILNRLPRDFVRMFS